MITQKSLSPQKQQLIVGFPKKENIFSQFVLILINFLKLFSSEIEIYFFQASDPSLDWGPYLKKFRGERYKDMNEPQEALELRNQDPEDVSPVYKKFSDDYQEVETTKI